ncbi:hypothetical protein [Prosthecomicrobium hirschii]|uniref:Uncharacterized protein n=1 Tax=Prosthecodimorpha hirschii TaxID=665126 RepID=A0A0P6WAF9_9HYPH|nr:hypothetical protein [Prosthecomicrobium hirschii]KPL55547.1 hypothetical protein ABB55_27675 [Prosthecomicrobium hirschii]MCW1839465.1 hypothetical protein [Prosthecomicrobium hirschii]
MSAIGGLGMIAGVLMLIRGFSIEGQAVGGIHQVFGAVYVCSGVTVFVLGAILITLAGIRDNRPS